MKMPNKKQRELIDAIRNDGIRGIYRRSRPMHLTIDQLDFFNKETADGKKRIQWHSPNWVAMDRKSFDNIMDALNKLKTSRMIIYDEFSTVSPELINGVKPIIEKHKGVVFDNGRTEKPN